MRDAHLEKNNRKKNAEHRRQYREAKAVDLWCRPPWQMLVVRGEPPLLSYKGRDVAEGAG